jgi:hypothetical protein
MTLLSGRISGEMTLAGILNAGLAAGAAAGAATWPNEDAERNNNVTNVTIGFFSLNLIYNPPIINSMLNYILISSVKVK